MCAALRAIDHRSLGDAVALCPDSLRVLAEQHAAVRHHGGLTTGRMVGSRWSSRRAGSPATLRCRRPSGRRSGGGRATIGQLLDDPARGALQARHKAVCDSGVARTTLRGLFVSSARNRPDHGQGVVMEALARANRRVGCLECASGLVARGAEHDEPPYPLRSATGPKTIATPSRSFFLQ
jgi:hypothetical protein